MPVDAVAAYRVQLHAFSDQTLLVLLYGERNPLVRLAIEAELDRREASPYQAASPLDALVECRG